MPEQTLPSVPLAVGLKRLAGFLAGALVVLPLGWGLVYLAYTQADRLGVAKTTAAAAAAVVSLILFLVLENRHRLSRLMGLEHNPAAPSWLSAGLLWLLGPVWLAYKVGAFGGHGTTTTLKKPDEGKKPHRDPFREAVETVVFVVMLVLLLKLFVVEAFVIPTGSMAETLYGYNKWATCDECGHEFAVNASREVEPQPGTAKTLTAGYCCPNCRHSAPKGLEKAGVTWTSGDRVLVGKFMGPDARGRVVVFKYPDAPQTGQVAQNYIKRQVGFGEETIAIQHGDVYVTKALKYDAVDADGKRVYPLPERNQDLWRAPYSDQYGNTRWAGNDFRYPNAAEAVDLFKRSEAKGFTLPDGFEVIRKPDDQVLEMRRIVYDNDHQAKSLVNRGAEPRWKADATWTADDAKSPKVFTHAGGPLGWVRYRHLLPKGVGDQSQPTGWTDPSAALEPKLITSFLGYNAGFESMPGFAGQTVQGHTSGSEHWCGDLILESTVTVTDPAATVAFELSKGTHRYRAEFDGGKVRLKMFPGEEEVQPPQGGKMQQPRNVKVGDDDFTLTSQPGFTKPGTYTVRFANVDSRLRVWIDDRAIDFGEKADYPPPPLTELGWTKANDQDEPASIGASGGVTVSKLNLFRDTHYTNMKGVLDTYYVQPGHYLCMGDNSAQSSDGRMWGLVPERLMLGRAVFVFWPYDRIGFIK